MGVTVRQKVKGSGQPWWVFVTHDGKRWSKKVGDKATANNLANKIRACIALGEVEIKKERYHGKGN